MLVNRQFTTTKGLTLNPGELWLIDDKQRLNFIQTFQAYAEAWNDLQVAKSIEFINFDNIIKPVHCTDSKFSNLFIVRAGGGPLRTPTARRAVRGERSSACPPRFRDWKRTGQETACR